MICHRCAFRLTSHAARPYPSLLASTSIRYASTTTAAPRGPPRGAHEGPPAATSTGAAQPFSNPLTPKGETGVPQASPSEPAAPKSSVPAGTPLKGLGYLKGKDPPMAKEDHEYPDWLWGILDEESKAKASAGGAGEGDAYAKSKKQRQIAARAAAKAAKQNPDLLLPKVPLDHQTIDLPSSDGTSKGSLEASKARKDLTAAMRNRRRKDIKERNFLTGM